MIKVGITGNIGSGKTTVCRIFELLNIPIVYADILAKELMQDRLHLRSFLIREAGVKAFEKNGNVNRSFLAKKIFNDPLLKQGLESVVHPAVQEYLQYWFATQSSPYAIEEAALIFESSGNRHLDKIIFVNSPLPLRLQRVTQRDQISESDFFLRENSQWQPEKKRALSDYQIENQPGHSLINQVLKIHKSLLSCQVP